MSAGTLALTNNSTTVTGTNTTFQTDLAANDFIVCKIGGTTYTLGVSAVGSNTALTLTQPFTGPTTSGVAWTAVANQALVGITTELAANLTTVYRSVIRNDANWMQFFSASDNINITLRDGTTVTGPSWNSVSTSLNNKAAKGANSDITSLTGLTTALSIGQGGTGQKTAAAAIAALGGLPLAGGTMTGVLNMGSNSINAINVLNFQTAAAARQSLLNMGVSLGTGNSLRIPVSQTQAYCIQVVTAVITLNSNGDSTVTYSQSYASIYSLVAISGDFNAMTGSVTVSDVGNNAFNVRFRTSGNTTPTGSVRINYIVAGLINI